MLPPDFCSRTASDSKTTSLKFLKNGAGLPRRLFFQEIASVRESWEAGGCATSGRRSFFFLWYRLLASISWCCWFFSFFFFACRQRWPDEQVLPERGMPPRRGQAEPRAPLHHHRVPQPIAHSTHYAHQAQTLPIFLSLFLALAPLSQPHATNV
jgi:hypothetical protein